MRLERAQSAGLEIKFQRPVLDTADLLDVMSDLLEHLADLPILALNECDLQPRIVGVAHPLDLCGRGLHVTAAVLRITATRDPNSMPQTVHIFFCRLP